MRARLRRLTPREAAEEMAHGRLLVDTRSADALRRDGVIPGALHVPRTVLEWRVDASSGHQSPSIAGHENDLILICEHGYSSSLAAATLHDLGYTGTTDVIGGFEAWAAEGLPVARAGDVGA
jgi:rhodanese-related sulfurtransferase